MIFCSYNDGELQNYDIGMIFFRGPDKLDTQEDLSCVLPDLRVRWITHFSSSETVLHVNIDYGSSTI